MNMTPILLGQLFCAVAFAAPNVGSQANKDLGGFELVEVAADEVEHEMLIATEASDVPESLQGLWWMDGNPLPDEVLSLARGQWDAANNTLTLDVFEDSIWTWHASEDGRSLYESARKANLTYEVQLDEEQTFGQIIPIVNIGFLSFRVPKFLANFTIEFSEDGLWLRESSFFGQKVNDYRFRRIVNADGTRTPAYDEYLERAPAVQLIARRIDE